MTSPLEREPDAVPSANPDPVDAVLARIGQLPEDASAFAELCRLIWPFVLALAHRSLPPSRRLLEAEDVAQDVYVRLARRIRRNEPLPRHRTGLYSFLAVMIRWLALDNSRWRSRARRNVSRERPGIEAESPSSQSAAAEVELRDLLDRVQSALEVEEQQILDLRLQGHAIAEIGAQLNMSTRTIERRLQRIRSVLRPYLDIAEQCNP